MATVYPNLAERLLGERGIEVELVRVTRRRGCAAPRARRRDRRSRLEREHAADERLRSLGALLASEAVLIARRGSDDRAREIATVLRSVVEARDTRYLMLNAPESALDEICRIVPGSRSPSIVPLAEEGMVALQALVPAADVWRLLPQLEAAGGSSILLVPVERMLR